MADQTIAATPTRATASTEDGLQGDATAPSFTLDGTPVTLQNPDPMRLPVDHQCSSVAGESGRFDLCAPATVARIQAACLSRLR
jgi:hypothetical protein